MAKEKAETITTYKGFDKNMKCRDFQFEVGKTYTHNGVVRACEGGFHGCEYPLDVFGYYAPGTSQFAIVEQSGEIARHDGDSKVASSVITIKAAVDIQGIVKAAIDFTYARIKKKEKENSKDNGNVSSSGSCGASQNSGSCGASQNSGSCGASQNSGYQGASQNSGSCGASQNSGVRGASQNSGVRGASQNSGYQGASQNSGYQGASQNSGDYGASQNSGVRGASFSNGYGAKAETTSENSIAVAIGRDNVGKASKGNWLVLVYRNEDWVIKQVKSAKAGKDIKADTWYKLTARGKFVEVKDD